MTETKAIYRTHRGKVLHVSFRLAALKLDGEAMPYRDLGSNAGNCAHGNMVDNLGQGPMVINGQLDESAGAKLMSDD